MSTCMRKQNGCVHTCVRMCVHIRSHVCARACGRVCVIVCARMRLCMCVWTCVHVCAQAHVCVCHDEIHSQVLKKVTKQDNFGDIIEIGDDKLDEEISKEARVFVEATSKEDALSTMHLKSPEMEPTWTILQECNEEK